MFSDYVESGPPLMNAAAGKIRATFKLKANVTIANTIRRAIISSTPAVAFRTEPAEKSEMTITVNTTPLVNEIISHRIGMVPILADPATFDPTHYEFVLNKENTTKDMMDVYAGDFQVFMKNPKNPLEAPVQIPTAQFFPPDPITGETVLITRLRPQWNRSAPNEQIQLKAKAAVSTGQENIRWSPVSQCSYEYTRDTNEEHLEDVFTNWLLNTKKIAKVTDISEEKLAELKREFNTMEVQRCYLTDERGDPTDFTFYIESVGTQTIPQIVASALLNAEALVRKYEDMDATLPKNVVVQQGDARFPCVDIVFTDESHTLGNLLETYLVENHVDGTSQPRITYAGYKVPHPLRPEMFVRIGVETDGGDADQEQRVARLAIATVCRQLRDGFRTAQATWANLFAKPSTTA
jgi:DNA-directed RNA polymerase subunit L/DNA-directed RNA polymerase alpha subunit